MINYVLIVCMTLMGSAASIFFKRASGSEGILKLIMNINLYTSSHLFNLNSTMLRLCSRSGGSGKYYCTAVFGLFGCTAAFFGNLYLDNGIILFHIKREHYGQKISRRVLHCSRSRVRGSLNKRTAGFMINS